jgi:DNA-directed RNA polymerase specialized sigma24 family protein
VAPPPERPPDAQTTACPCGRGDVPAQLAGQRPLLARAATGDREAFAQLYDAQVEGVYRYLLAWTGDRSEAAILTSRVFHSALAWLPPTAGGGVEAGAWLTAMSRHAVSDRPGSGRDPAPVADPVAALAQLPDSEREVLVLRLLCGHTLDHTAHLAGYSRRAVLGLQLAACLVIAERTGGAPAPPGASAEEFERRLAPSEITPATADPALSAALTAASALRQAAAEVVDPDPELVASLRHDLTSAEPPAHPAGPLAPAEPPRAHPEESLTDPEPHPTHPGPVPTHAGPEAPHPLGPGAAAPTRSGAAAPTRSGAAPDPPGPLPGPPNGRVADRRERGAGLSTAHPVALPTALRAISPLRRPWVSTAVATAGIVALLALQAFGNPGPRPGCDGRPCPARTTVAAVAGVGNLGTPLTTIVESSTTTSTAAEQAPPTSAPRTSASAPPTTRPAPTAPQSTRAPRTTTTRAPTTTASTTTAASTTTTAAPAPT